MILVFCCSYLRCSIFDPWCFIFYICFECLLLSRYSFCIILCAFDWLFGRIHAFLFIFKMDLFCGSIWILHWWSILIVITRHFQICISRLFGFLIYKIFFVLYCVCLILILFLWPVHFSFFAMSLGCYVFIMFWLFFFRQTCNFGSDYGFPFSTKSILRLLKVYAKAQFSVYLKHLLRLTIR